MVRPGHHRDERPKRVGAGEFRKRRLKLWAHGRFDLGLDDGEIGRLTLGELAALEECRRDRVHHEDWRTAVIACVLINSHRGKDDKVVQPADVFPWLGDKPKEKPAGQQSTEQMRALMEQITFELGGKVNKKNIPLG